MVDKAFIHVGFMKTASTYLQINFFASISDYNFKYINNVDGFREILNHIRYENLQADKDLLKSVIDFFDKYKNYKIIISSEALVGSPYYNYLNRDNIWNNLKLIFCDISVLMIVRKQISYFDSLYTQTLHEGFHQSYKSFLNIHHGLCKKHKPLSRNAINLNVKSQNYNEFYNFFSSKSFVSNVKVLPYELLIDSKKTFLKTIAKDFLKSNCDDIVNKLSNEDDKPNKSYSQLSVNIAKVFNRFMVSNHIGGIRFIPQKPFFKTFDKIYKKSNIKLFKYLRGISARLTLRYFLQGFVNKLNYKKPRYMSNESYNKLMNIFYVSNKELDEKLNLNLSRYNYY